MDLKTLGLGFALATGATDCLPESFNTCPPAGQKVVCPRGHGMGSCGADMVAMCLTDGNCGYRDKTCEPGMLGPREGGAE